MSGHEAYCALHKGYFSANEPCPYCLELRERKRDMPNELGSQVYAFTFGMVSAMLYVDLRDRKGGDPEEWPEELRRREFPKPYPGHEVVRLKSKEAAA